MPGYEPQAFMHNRYVPLLLFSRLLFRPVFVCGFVDCCHATLRRLRLCIGVSCVIIIIIMTLCCHRRRSHWDCESYASVILLSFSDPCRMVLSIPCGEGAIRVYERPRGGGPEPQMKYQAAFTAGTGTRLWGGLSTSIWSIVASLWPKLKFKKKTLLCLIIAGAKFILKNRATVTYTKEFLYRKCSIWRTVWVFFLQGNGSMYLQFWKCIKLKYITKSSMVEIHTDNFNIYIQSWFECNTINA